MAVPGREMSFGLLNAYVDGELDRAMSAEVAAAAAEDATIAARIATLSKLKASIGRPDLHTVGPPNISIGSPRRPWSSWRLNAATVCVVLVVATGLLTYHHSGSEAPQTWVEGALTAQRQWLASASSHDPQENSVVTIGALASARPIDLSDAQLGLVYVAQLTSPFGAETTFLGYRGPRGCMVGLWISVPQDDLGPEPKEFDVGDFRVRAWKDRAATYALIAKGMDPRRIDHLAQAVARLVDPTQGVDDGSRAALRDTTRIGGACRV